MRLHRGSSGFAILPILVALAALAATGYYVNTLKSAQVEVAQRGYASLAAEVNEIHAAALRFFRAGYPDQRFPDSMAELLASGLYVGRPESPFGTAYEFNTITLPTGLMTFNVSVNTTNERIARAASSITHNGSSAGTALSSSIRAPFQNEIYDDYLQRYSDPSRPQMTTMETDLVFAGVDRDLRQVNELQAFQAEITELVAPEADITELFTTLIHFGDGPRISAAGNELLLDADVVRTTGGMVLGGALDMAGQDIMNTNRIVGQEITAPVGFIDDITGINLDYVSGQIQLLSGQELNYVTGEIRALSGVELDYVQGRIRQLTGDQLTYGSGTISNLAGSTLNYGSGTIGSLAGTTLNYNSGTIGNLSGTTLNYNSGSIGNLSGTTLNYSNVNASSVVAGSGRHSTLTVLGNSLLNTLQSTQYTTGTYRANSATAQTVNVSDRLQAANLVSSESSLGVAQASSFDVSGLLSSAGLTTNFASVQQGQIQSVSGTNMTYASIHAGEFIGGTFYGDDFITSSGASENQIRIDLDQRKAELDNCMYITEFCMPRAPDVSLSCPNCIQSREAPNFSATVTASISQCRHGCSYDWNIGSGLSGTCPSGTIPAGGSASVQCSVTGTVEAATTLNSSVQIAVRNSARPDKNTTRTANVRWTNSSPAIPVWAQLLTWDYISYRGSYRGGNVGPINSGVGIFPRVNGQYLKEVCSSCTITVTPLQTMQFTEHGLDYDFGIIDLRSVYLPMPPSGYGFGLFVHHDQNADYPSAAYRAGNRLLRFTVSDGQYSTSKDFNLHAEAAYACQVDTWHGC